MLLVAAGTLLATARAISVKRQIPRDDLIPASMIGRAGMWPRDGVLIPDEQMPSYTHLNSFRDVCIHTVPGTEDHLLYILNVTDPQQRILRNRNCKSIEPTWNGDGHDCGMANFRASYVRKEEMKSLEWVDAPTQILAFPVTNPGHFVSDVLWTLFPRFGESDPFSQVVLADDPYCESWMCHKLKAYYQVKNKKEMPVLRGVGERSFMSACYREVYIPQLTRWRWQPDEVPNLNVSALLRQELTKTFPKSSGNVLLYNHKDGHGRVWKNAEDFVGLLEKRGYEVRLLQGFSGLSYEEQCEAYWHAKFILTPHGGHMGNLLCAGNGTTVVEMSCSDHVGWFTSASKYQDIMGWTYGYEQVPPEYCAGEDSNPFMDSWEWPADKMLEIFDKWREINDRRPEEM